jgi:hypothetical protein
MADKGLIPALFCFLLFAAIGLSAPIWHDEAVVFLEFAGRYVSADKVTSAWALKTWLLHAHPGLVQLLANVSKLGFQITPPLFYVLLWVWRHCTGDSLTAERTLSLICWVSMLLVFRLWSGSPFAVALLMLNSLGIEMATLARPYALAILLIVLSAYLLDPERRSSKRAVWLGGICAALAVWTHYLATIPVAVIVASRTLWIWPVEKKRSVPVLAAAALAALPCAYILFRQLRQTPQSFLSWTTEGYSLIRELLRLPLSPSLITGQLIDLTGSCLFLAVILTTAATFWTRSYKVRLSLLVISCQAVSLLIVGGVTRGHPATRYLVLTLPFCCLLVADWCNRFTPIARHWKYLIPLTAAFCSTAGAVALMKLERTQKEFLQDPAAAPMLFISSSGIGAGSMAVMLHEIPDKSDFVALSPDQDMAAFAPVLKGYKEAWICPSDEPARPHEAAVLNRSTARQIRLFREYSCYRIPDPQHEPISQGIDSPALYRHPSSMGQAWRIHGVGTGSVVD